MSTQRRPFTSLADEHPWLLASRGHIAVALARVDRAILEGTPLDKNGGVPARDTTYELLVALCDLSNASQHATHRYDAQLGHSGMVPPLNTRFQVVSGECCDTCHRPSFVSDSCKHAHYAIEGRVYRRVPWGAEAGPDRDGPPKASPGDARGCPDCGVAVGGFHHAWCQHEDCPACPEEPLIFCHHFRRDGFHTAGVLHDAIREARRLLRAERGR